MELYNFYCKLIKKKYLDLNKTDIVVRLILAELFKLVNNSYELLQFNWQGVHRPLLLHLVRTGVFRI